MRKLAQKGQISRLEAYIDALSCQYTKLDVANHRRLKSAASRERSQTTIATRHKHLTKSEQLLNSVVDGLLDGLDLDE